VRELKEKKKGAKGCQRTELVGDGNRILPVDHEENVQEKEKEGG
jgi:hypothetical protein